MEVQNCPGSPRGVSAGCTNLCTISNRPTFISPKTARRTIGWGWHLKKNGCIRFADHIIVSECHQCPFAMLHPSACVDKEVRHATLLRRSKLRDLRKFYLFLLQCDGSDIVLVVLVVLAVLVVLVGRQEYAHWK